MKIEKMNRFILGVVILLGVLVSCRKETAIIDSSPRVECIQGPVDSLAICPAVVLPVCGCNGVTYNNSCLAEAAGISNYTNGPCGTNEVDCIQGPINPDAICPAVVLPVCGCNDVTYGNSCLAEAAGITNYVNGPCTGSETPCVQGPVNPDAICPTVVLPVCGCNEVTYGNSCLAEAAGITNYISGPCGTSNCIQGPVDPLAICPMVVDPVCGCNRVTYGNSCLAEAAGISNYSTGSCGANEPSCISDLINDFNSDVNCFVGVNVKKYYFQNQIVYAFNPGNCGACESIEIIDSNCNHLGHLGGITGGSFINGEDFSTAIYVSLVWQKL